MCSSLSKTQRRIGRNYNSQYRLGVNCPPMIGRHWRDDTNFGPFICAPVPLTDTGLAVHSVREDHFIQFIQQGGCDARLCNRTTARAIFFFISVS